jgi:hypothetical protein
MSKRKKTPSRTVGTGGPDGVARSCRGRLAAFLARGSVNEASPAAQNGLRS